MKLKLEDRWKHRASSKRRAVRVPPRTAVVVPAPVVDEAYALAAAPGVDATPTTILTPVIDEAQARLDQLRINKWISDRLVAEVPGLCWHCRLPFIIGQRFVDVRGDEVVVRFHARCENEWRRQQESAARRAMGMMAAVKGKSQ